MKPATSPARLTLLTLALGLGAWTCCPPKPVMEANGPAPAPLGSAERTATAKPRLVLVVIIDQLSSWLLERYLPHLPKDGAMLGALASGTYVEKVAYDYAITYTAPGHAAVHSGASPHASGIVANAVFDEQHGERAMVSDGVHPVFGHTAATASPTMMRAETVADVLERVTSGKAVTLSLAVKDRAAVLGGGKHPDLVVWYDKDAKGFTTSSYYRSELPNWLVDWQRQHPTDALFVRWEADDPDMFARVAGPDDAQAEGDWAGLGTTFPHDVASSSQPYSVLRTTPMLTDQLMTLAREAIDQQGVGDDDVIDMVAISIAGPDYAGHIFGPLSWEYLDNLIRADRALGKLVGELDQRFDVSLLITSDHGVAMVPEQAQGEVGRMFQDELEARMKKALEKAGLPALQRFAMPYLHLAPGAREGDRRRQSLETVRKLLAEEKGYHALFDVREAHGWIDDADPLRRAVGRSVAKGVGGDFYLVCKPGWMVDDTRAMAYGSNHGSPWTPDREVPVLMRGRGVKVMRVAETLEQKRVAATIAALLGVAPPEHARSVKPLPGVEATK